MDVDRAIQSRVIFGLMLTIGFGVVPSLAMGMLMLQSMSVEGNIAEPGLSEYVYSLVIAAVLPLILTLIPGYPLSMKVVVNEKFAKLLDTLTAVGAFFLALPAAMLVINSDVSIFKEKESVFNYASTSLALSLPGFLLILQASFASKVDAVVEDMLNYVRVWRSLHLYRSSVLERSKERDWALDRRLPR